MRKYHEGKRRGWIKVHVAVDVESKELLSIGITDEKTGDSEVFEELVENLDLEDCLADGAYDSEEIFELLEGKGVDPPPGVKLRKDANTGLSPRGKAAKQFHDLGRGVEGRTRLWETVERRRAFPNPYNQLIKASRLRGSSDENL